MRRGERDHFDQIAMAKAGAAYPVVSVASGFPVYLPGSPPAVSASASKLSYQDRNLSLLQPSSDADRCRGAKGGGGQGMCISRS